MNYRYVLAIDPSGSFHEGKGTTGWCLMDTIENIIIRSDFISAEDYSMMEGYWDAHLKLLSTYARNYKQQLVVVIEDYLLYATKSDVQINSRMETCKLIGAMQHHCWKTGIRYFMQTASLVKSRWTDEILCHKKYLVKQKVGYALSNGKTLNKHCKDSIRHAVHFATFKNEKVGV